MLRELIERALRVKIDVVVDDLKETGGAGGHPGREMLNYGHTLGTPSSAPSATTSGTAPPWRSG